MKSSVYCCLWHVFVLYNQNKASEMISLSVSLFQKVSGMSQRQTGYEESIHVQRLQAFSTRYSSAALCAVPQKKVPQATDRNSKHPYIGWAISWPLLQYPRFLHLFTVLLVQPRSPSLQSCRAPIGCQSCSIGRLLAPFYQNLAEAARICPHTNSSLAFCLWKDGTESEGKKTRWKEERQMGGRWG